MDSKDPVLKGCLASLSKKQPIINSNVDIVLGIMWKIVRFRSINRLFKVIKVNNKVGLTYVFMIS